MAAGNHVVTTPRGAFEASLETGVTYIPDNAPRTIADCLQTLIHTGRYTKTAESAALRIYGPDAVSQTLNNLLTTVTATS